LDSLVNILHVFKNDKNRKVMKVLNKEDNLVYLLKGFNLYTSRKNAESEFGVFGKIHSPFIPALKECFVDSNIIYGLEEFFESMTLASYIQDAKQRADEDVLFSSILFFRLLQVILFIVSQVSLGLFELHRKGFMHTDLHGYNILVSKKKRPPEIRISFFLFFYFAFLLQLTLMNLNPMLRNADREPAVQLTINLLKCVWEDSLFHSLFLSFLLDLMKRLTSSSWDRWFFSSFLLFLVFSPSRSDIFYGHQEQTL
jgi:serine/threonine protein kinase